MGCTPVWSRAKGSIGVPGGAPVGWLQEAGRLTCGNARGSYIPLGAAVGNLAQAETPVLPLVIQLHRVRMPEARLFRRRYDSIYCRPFDATE
jgi:hypothetical protein